MKKINLKKVGIIALWCVGIAGLVSSLAFVRADEKKVKGKTVTISIEQDDENSFIDEDDILKFLKDRHDTLINQPMKDINVFQLEKVLNTHPSIANAEVAATVSGDVSITIKQRKPMVRIINTQGESFYIDNKATVMPLADHYTARVLVANGFIPEKYSQFYDFSIPQIEKDSAFKAITVLDDIYNVSSYIKNDSLLNGLITQMYINGEREIELYPSVGNQKIIFGDGSDIADKFEKLKTFYIQGLNCVDGWNKYSIINLKYKNQVVCIKKNFKEEKPKPIAVPVVAEKKKEEIEKKDVSNEPKVEEKESKEKTVEKEKTKASNKEEKSNSKPKEEKKKKIKSSKENKDKSKKEKTKK